jgi:SAM-dependent methyltransferase
VSRGRNDEISRSWDANASAWSTAVRERQIESRRVATDAAIVSAVLEQHPQTVLDLGCGEGWLARALADHGIEVTGIDGSAALIEAARQLGGGEFHALPYHELATLGRTFDLAIANFSLFEKDLHDLLSNIPARTLVVQTVHPSFAETDGWQVETFAKMPGDWPKPMPWYFRRQASWTTELERAGWAVLQAGEVLHPEQGDGLSMIFVAEKQ